MALFDKALRTAKNIGDSVVGTAASVGAAAGAAVQEQSELAGLKMQLNSIDFELDSAYIQIGRRYVEYVVETQEMPQIDAADILTLAEAKLERKQELEDKILELEKQIKQKTVLRQKEQAEEEFRSDMQTLDKALDMGILTREEYAGKSASLQKKLDNFAEIRRVEQQYDMGIISRAERDEKLKSLIQ